ncbi:MAG: hypothetical protein H6Q00_826 [Holophagaceae bacterium]|nr:hypothetical protein [Holophagaceae bacterium]
MTRMERAFQGGSLVAANHLAGICISAAAALLVSRALGPKGFAVIAICGSITAVTRIISRLGINAYLITQPEAPAEEDYHIALTAMLASSIATGSITILLLPGMERFSHVTGIFWPGVATIALLPLHVASLPAITRLERNLQFKKLMQIEFVAQLLGPSIGIGLVLKGWGIWGILLGWLARALFTALALWITVRQLPRFAWDGRRVLHMCKFGFKYLLASSIDQSRNLLLLFTVGRVIGHEAVGHIELTLRALRLITPIRAAAGRVLLPALAPLARIPRMFTKAITASVETELMLSVPITVAGAWLYPYCVRLLLGAAWQPTIQVFPWMAGAALLTSTHATVLSALHIRGYFKESILSNSLGHLCLVLLVFMLGSHFGLEGCAAAGIFAWPTFWFREWIAAKYLDTRWSRNAVAWAMGGSAACFAERHGILFLMPLAIVSVITFPAIHRRMMALLCSSHSLPRS